MTKILIFRIGEIGDSVVAIPVFRKILTIFDNAEFHLLSNQKSSDVILDLTSSKNTFNKIYSISSFKNNINLLRSLRSENYDYLYYIMPQRSFYQLVRDKIFFFLTNIPNKYGLGFDCQKRHPSKSGMYESEMNRLYRSIFNENINAHIIQKYYYLPPLESIECLSKNAFNIAITLKSKDKVKNWPLENWVDLIKLLNKRIKNVNFIFIGGENDNLYVSSVVIRSGINNYRNYAGKLSILKSASIINSADFYIGLDNGPSHIASILKKNMISIFSSRNLPGEWYPYNSKVMYTKISCMGCRLRVCKKYNSKCIKSISPQDVFSMFVEINRRNKKLKYED